MKSNRVPFDSMTAGADPDVSGEIRRIVALEFRPVPALLPEPRPDSPAEACASAPHRRRGVLA